MNLIITIATGNKSFGNFALNLALSIKANEPNQKIGLIYSDDAIADVKELVDRHFDYGMRIFYDECKTPQELAFKTKTELYDIATKMCPEADTFLFLDADTVMLPSRKTADWFEQHRELNFTSYCNDMYHFATKTRKRKDYTFWCNPEQAKEYFDLHNGSRMPQVNSSFLYFKKSDEAKRLFDEAYKVWVSDFNDFTQYKEAKPDELCFNIACAKTGIYPHRNTYRPIYFQVFQENHSHEEMLHQYRAFGLAGSTGHLPYIIDWYNNYTRYYRNHFAIIAEWYLNKETKGFVDETPINIHPVSRRTLYREGEIENSGAGIFNPSGLILKDGTRYTIFRKEKDFDTYKRYKHTTGIPHLHVLRANGETDTELKLINFDGARVEDFRLFICGQAIFCNYHEVRNNHTDNMEIKVGLAYLNENMLVAIAAPVLPYPTKRVEKNWVFFGEKNRMYCIYSLSPYRIFYADAETQWQEWARLDVPEATIDFVHKGMISNSTNPVLIDGYYLSFFHTKANGVYYKGAVLINAETKQIEYYTRHTIPFNARNDGWQKSLHYISGVAYDERRGLVRVFYGENDSHSCYADYDKNKLIAAIKEEE